EQLDEVGPDGGTGGLRQRPLHRRERGDQQVLLARPAPVEGGLADPGPGGPVLAAHPADAALADRLDGGVDDRLLGLLAARTAGAPGAVAAAVLVSGGLGALVRPGHAIPAGD